MANLGWPWRIKLQLLTPVKEVKMESFEFVVARKQKKKWIISQNEPIIALKYLKHMPAAVKEILRNWLCAVSSWLKCWNGPKNEAEQLDRILHASSLASKCVQYIIELFICHDGFTFLPILHQQFFYFYHKSCSSNHIRDWFKKFGAYVGLGIRCPAATSG